MTPFTLYTALIYLLMNFELFSISLRLLLSQILKFTYWQIDLYHNVAKDKTNRMVPLLARSAHRDPQGQILEIFQFLKYFLLMICLSRSLFVMLMI